VATFVDNVHVEHVLVRYCTGFYVGVVSRALGGGGCPPLCHRGGPAHTAYSHFTDVPCTKPAVLTVLTVQLLFDPVH
jgi:hypothetical protein